MLHNPGVFQAEDLVKVKLLLHYASISGLLSVGCLTGYSVPMMAGLIIYRHVALEQR